jgi:Holliday junction DNA helicase RuvA
VYDYIEGRLSERRPAHLVLEAGGVGYDLAVPLGADFPVQDGRVRAWTHLVVREDAHLLFGFPERERRELFRLLLEVRGVGPAVALAVLSTLPGDELLRAIAAQDAAPFLRVRGIGKKTAEQILLDLRDKAPRMLAEPVEPGRGTLVPRAAGSARRLEDAVRALVSIGYSDKEARKSVERAAARVPGEDLELLVRTALQE